MRRPELKITLDQGARRWLLHTARKHYWRVAAWYDLDDLLQDGQMHFARIVFKYPHVKNRAHLMRLFQVTFINHLHDLAKSRTHELETVAEFSRYSPLDDPTKFVTALAHAPDPLRTLLRNLAHDIPALRRPYLKRADGTRETLNERLCQIAGVLPNQVDFPKLMHEALA